MTGLPLVLGVLVSLTAFALLLLPPGYAASRLLGVRLEGWSGVSSALAAGFCLVLPLVRIESLLGGPYLVLPLVLLTLVWLRPAPASFRWIVAAWPELLLLALLAGFATLVNASAVGTGPAGLSLALGFDVSDPAFYAAVTQELERASLLAVQNPVFAGEPLQYSFLPELAALLLGRYTGAPLLAVVFVHLPAVALAFVGVAVLGLLQAWGVATRTARFVTVGLVVLGGDLSWLLWPLPTLGFERSAHFFSFYSFSAESLLYNPWMLGIPLSLAFLTLLEAWAARGRAAELWMGALVLASLWETKVFAFAALSAGTALWSLARRRARLLWLPALGCLLATPAIVTTALSGTAREGPPLELSPLFLVRTAIGRDFGLHPLAELVGAASGGAGLALVTLVFLAGGLGIRLVGLPRFWRALRAGASDSQGVLAWSVVAALAAGLLVRGNPTAIEGVQFLLFAQATLWLYAGPILGEWLAPGPARRRGAALLLLATALPSPLGYAARKGAPERFTSPHAPDRARTVLSPGTLAACEWIAGRAPSTEPLLVPVSRAPGEAVRGLYLAVLAGRRVPAAVDNPFHVSAALAAERVATVRRFYATASATEAERLLDALGVALVWEDEAHPLAFASDRLQPVYAAGGVRLHRVRPAP